MCIIPATAMKDGFYRNRGLRKNPALGRVEEKRPPPGHGNDSNLQSQGGTALRFAPRTSLACTHVLLGSALEGVSSPTVSFFSSRRTGSTSSLIGSPFRFYKRFGSWRDSLILVMSYLYLQYLTAVPSKSPPEPSKTIFAGCLQAVERTASLVDSAGCGRCCSFRTVAPCTS